MYCVCCLVAVLQHYFLWVFFSVYDYFINYILFLATLGPCVKYEITTEKQIVRQPDLRDHSSHKVSQSHFARPQKQNIGTNQAFTKTLGQQGNVRIECFGLVVLQSELSIIMDKANLTLTSAGAAVTPPAEGITKMQLGKL